MDTEIPILKFHIRVHGGAGIAQSARSSGQSSSPGKVKHYPGVGDYFPEGEAIGV
jgi:hypothetical protein